mgnify:CR=1 FL=1
MVVKLDMTVSPDPGKLAAGVHQWGSLIQDWRPVWSDIREVYDRHQVEHFASKGASTGPKWAGNSDPDVPNVPGRGGGPYDKWKERRGHTGGALLMTGLLRDAATGKHGSLQKETATTMEMGVDGRTVPYAIDHHQGNAVDSALFRRVVQLKQRPVIRMAGSVLGDKSVFDAQSNRGTFGYAVRQLVQAHIVKRRQIALDGNPAAADRTIATILASRTR